MLVYMSTYVQYVNFFAEAVVSRLVQYLSPSVYIYIYIYIYISIKISLFSLLLSGIMSVYVCVLVMCMNC